MPSVITNVALVDDHKLFRKCLLGIIQKFQGFHVIMEAVHGKDLICQLKPEALPDIILLNLPMPEMDGLETARWLQQQHPQIKILVISMDDEPEVILQLIRLGIKGFLSKKFGSIRNSSSA